MSAQNGATDHSRSTLSGISPKFPLSACEVAARNYFWFNSALSAPVPLYPSRNPLNANKVQIMR